VLVVARGDARIDNLKFKTALGKGKMLSPEVVADITGRGPFAFTMLHPMVGGLPPELAWRSLELIEQEVLPALR
jgi:prolyl-tRNA editing enzyme YbaK/EbsC (Cys-tRNA(Pro) deacylase)